MREKVIYATSERSVVSLQKCICLATSSSFSFRRSVQDYKIQMDMEIVTFEGKQGVKPLQ